MNSTEFADLLEVVASGRPDLLRPLIADLEYSPAGGALAELARAWRTAKLAQLAATTARHLDQLERKRLSAWRRPSQVVETPNVPALASFAGSRRGRVSEIARSRRLELLAMKLERVAEGERRRQVVESFLSEPAPPIDPAWLRNFLEPRRA